jgi:hypothetical protein
VENLVERLQRRLGEQCRGHNIFVENGFYLYSAHHITPSCIMTVRFRS